LAGALKLLSAATIAKATHAAVFGLDGSIGGVLEMYGIAYVIIPTEFKFLQSILDEALSPFRRCGAETLPRESLTFDDVTDDLRQLHDLRITLRREGAGVVVRSGDSTTVGDLDFDELRNLLQCIGQPSWIGRLADIEPDFDAFVHRFTRWKQRDPEADGYGRWLNPLGRWDWWELGGRFDGLVSGQPQSGAGMESMISSGENRGRDLLGGVMRALGGNTSDVEAEIAANVDLVSSLLEAARRGEPHAFPTAVVLPVDAGAPDLRWFDALGWRPIPAQTKALLFAAEDASFNEAATAAYERFADMAVAGISYHF
jgi:hypothetical protein